MYSAHGYELTSNCVLYFYLLKLSYMETTSVGSLWRLKKKMVDYECTVLIRSVFRF